MKRNKKDQPIIRRPKPFSIIEGLSHRVYPDNQDYRIAFMKGAHAMADLISEQNPERSVATEDHSSTGDGKQKNK